MVIDAILCDAATVREGLLHVLGGGINRVFRKEFPAPMGVQIAMVLEIDIDELSESHELSVVIKDENDEEITKLGADLKMNQQGDAKPNGDTVNLPLVLPTQGVPLPKPGEFYIDIFINDEHHRTLTLLADPIPETAGAAAG